MFHYLDFRGRGRKPGVRLAPIDGVSLGFFLARPSAFFERLLGSAGLVSWADLAFPCWRLEA